MKKVKILVTGSTGFVGTNFIKYVKESSNIELDYLTREQLNSEKITIFDYDVILHLAGKAHDLKNTSKTDEYYRINFGLTKNLIDSFIESNVSKFIYISSVKAVADSVKNKLDESYQPNPFTPYGKSKLLAEKYIQEKLIDSAKKFYIIRPCMIHGPGNKGNLNLLYSFVEKGIPWPLGGFMNRRSFLSIENLCFVIREIGDRDDISSGIYNLADDESLSTNTIIDIISEVIEKRIRVLKIPQSLIRILFSLGDILHLPFNMEKLDKLTESYVVDNSKILKELGKPLPVKAVPGIKRTFKSFKSNF
jgi:nucleoside-diphosphate-sugar epimerase